jgi:hypothetical protein
MHDLDRRRRPAGLVPGADLLDDGEFGYAKRRLLRPGRSTSFRSTSRSITTRGCSASTSPASGAWKSSRQFRAALLNSVVTSVAATLLCVAISALGAYAFTRLQFPGRKALFGLVVATLAIPAYAVLIPLYQIMIKLHLVDTYVGVALIYVSAFLPLSLWLLRSVFEALADCLGGSCTARWRRPALHLLQYRAAAGRSRPDRGGDPDLPRCLGTVSRPRSSSRRRQRSH